jgi:hypothetical protein
LGNLYGFLGGWGLYRDQLWIPGFGAASGITFVGDSLIVLIFAIAFSCGNLLLPVLDHFDQRDNEVSYRRIENIFAICSLILIIYASILAQG